MVIIMKSRSQRRRKGVVYVPLTALITSIQCYRFVVWKICGLREISLVGLGEEEQRLLNAVSIEFWLIRHGNKTIQCLILNTWS